uniref:TRP C-terminal domain-containing protein n=1 Tax=Amphimedon queenslandica TaxID=400682 RepID=A0A1X7TCE3_AMPQE
MCYQVNKCFDGYIDAGPIEVTLYIQTLDLINISTSRTVNVTIQCISDKGTCNDKPTNSTSSIKHLSRGLSLNNGSNECDKHGFLIFIVIEILPITIMVLLIIIFNIQLTNGSINGVVFYSQIMTISYSVYYNYIHDYDSDYDPYRYVQLSVIPCNIFNLNFTPFVYNYSMCISPNTPPLRAISFWYVIGFYPLLLLLLLYVWIALYDKSYKCVVFITRPFHRCMARFWSMTGIEPSFTHSIASIYILCFTQLAATSFKILSVAPKNETLGFNSTKFYYDIKQDYFKGVHGAAGFFAILVLLFLIVLPTLYILLYPFQWFHELLNCLHLRKQLLISLGDVFTGPYKNGTENTYDYRFMAGLYLLARIIILSQFIYGHYSVHSMPISQSCCSFLLTLIVIIFCTFQRNIHNLTEFLIMFLMTVFGCIISVTTYLILRSEIYLELGSAMAPSIPVALPIVNGLIFGIIITGYIIYQVYKMIVSCYHYHKRNNPVANRNQEGDHQPLVGNDDDWIADRMENPQEYDEQHVPGRMYDVSGEHHQRITIATAATYGSIDEVT